MKIYADTSVFGGVFDKEFSDPSRRFFDEARAGRFELVISVVVEATNGTGRRKDQAFFANQIASATIADVSEHALELQSQYVAAGIVTKKSVEDAQHVAVATVSNCNLIVSWNFKLIVHFDKIPK